MALQGTIDAFPVVDVLNLLAGSHKTGRLIVEGDRSTAQLFVLDGAVTGGGVQGIDEAPLADVVAELLRYSEGSFLFEPGTLAPAPQEPGDLISCGTPDSPEHQQRTMAGDTMIAEIEGIGKMTLGIRNA